VPLKVSRPRLITAGAAALMLAALSACGGDGDAAERSVESLKFIGQTVLARRSEFSGTVLGGLSGIDYDEANKRFVFITDDRTTTDSANAPRFYNASLTFDATSFGGVIFNSTFALKQPSGANYPKVPDLLTADPESIRIDPVNGNLVWSSEGERTLTSTPQRLINPFIREIKPDGTHVREYTLPAMFQMKATETGPRGNLAIEGLSFTPDRLSLVALMEGALFDDAATPTVSAGSVSRITVFNRESGLATAQYAYPLDKVQATPVPADQFTVNGATEILAVTNERFLVLERSFSVGVVGNQVRLYEINIKGATNVLSVPALKTATFTPVSKRLVLDFESIKTQLGGVANLEGLTFGPKLANGRDSLVLVADDNFPAADSLTDKNQFLVFEVIPTP
jgi:hypothetical protein